MLPDGNEAFWWVFVGLLAYECLDKQGAFSLLLVHSARGWVCQFPQAAWRFRGGYLHLNGPLDWFRAEVAVNWLRVGSTQGDGEPSTAVEHGGVAAAESRDASAERIAALRTLRAPIGLLACSLLVALPAVAWVVGVSSWLLLVMVFIYGSAAWLGWRLNALGSVAPDARAALRSLGLEIFFCPLFGLGAMRKAATLCLPAQFAHYRQGLAPGEWTRLLPEVALRLAPLEAYWGDAEPGSAREHWQTLLSAARSYYVEIGDAA